ncbi:195_t:CDS:2 [Funneliformis caledonium]|uniref:195_t:CDS:1 n=1 Tax=Funneliformis caledonium TaxID=1117310 RepID=A0A9N9I1C6_9GLOM|nr:195_t:CDS:2 [Funneliformis caledonium]
MPVKMPVDELLFPMPGLVVLLSLFPVAFDVSGAGTGGCGTGGAPG